MRSQRSSSALDEQDDGTFANQLADEVDPGIVEALARDEWVELLPGLQAQGQPQVPVVGQPSGSGGRRVVLREAEVLLQDLRQRPVGGALSVGERPARPSDRFGCLLAEPGPQLAGETRLAHAGFPEDRDQVRLA
jgi:hypothetical protein